MLTDTEIKIIVLMQAANRSITSTNEILAGCEDLAASLYSLQRKGVLHIHDIQEKDNDPLHHIELTAFGRLAKIKTEEA